MAKKNRLMTLPSVPLSVEASKLKNRLLGLIKAILAEYRRLPVSVLLWGPGIQSASPLAEVRVDLRRELCKRGHVALFSEEICEENGCSIRVQQLAQAQVFDLIVSIPCTPGAIAEIHDFATERKINGKLLVFIDESYKDGYSNKSLAAISNVAGCHVMRYANERDTAVILRETLLEVERIREMKYLSSGKSQP
jgi:hypothetical protein